MRDREREIGLWITVFAGIRVLFLTGDKKSVDKLFFFLK